MNINKEIIKQEFNIKNEITKTKISKTQLDAFLIKYNCKEDDLKHFIVNKKKDCYTLQIQRVINPSVNGMSNSQAQKMADQFISPDKVADCDNKVNTYTDVFKAYRKQIVYNFFINKNVYDIVDDKEVFNNSCLSKLNIFISKELLTYNIEYRKDFIFKTLNSFLIFLKDSFNINTPQELKNIDFKYNDYDKKLIINRNRFMRQLKNDFLTKDKNKFLKYFQTYEFEQIVNQIKEQKSI